MRSYISQISPQLEAHISWLSIRRL